MSDVLFDTAHKLKNYCLKPNFEFFKWDTGKTSGIYSQETSCVRDGVGYQCWW